MGEPTDATSEISRRKLEHLQLALDGGVEGPSPAGWDDVRLLHNCLPELDFDDIDLRTSFLGQTLDAPLWITGMTGGHEQAALINQRLAAVAQRYGLAMGLGSQRAALKSEQLMRTYQAARQAAPRAVLIANIGAPQLIGQGDDAPLSIESLEELVTSIDAQGLAIHLNFLQEMVQPEGDRRASGVLAAIAQVCSHLSVPVMVKETGAGIAREEAVKLREAGVQAIDVGGAGGTSMVRIEGARARQQGHAVASLAAAFDGWGIPTAVSVLETRGCGLPIVATGGVRSGVDAARALALGAHAVGVGLPFLKAADQGEDALDRAVKAFLHELRAALFLTGSRTPMELQERGAVILGDLSLWAHRRNLDLPAQISSSWSPS